MLSVSLNSVGYGNLHGKIDFLTYYGNNDFKTIANIYKQLTNKLKIHFEFSYYIIESVREVL